MVWNATELIEEVVFDVLHPEWKQTAQGKRIRRAQRLVRALQRGELRRRLEAKWGELA